MYRVHVSCLYKSSSSFFQMFVESSGSEEGLLFSDSKFYKILDRYQHTIKLSVALPDPSSKPKSESLCSKLVCAISLPRNQLTLHCYIHTYMNFISVSEVFSL
jgi:hypothetical protein